MLISPEGRLTAASRILEAFAPPTVETPPSVAVFATAAVPPINVFELQEVPTAVTVVVAAIAFPAVPPVRAQTSIVRPDGLFAEHVG